MAENYVLDLSKVLNVIEKNDLELFTELDDESFTKWNGKMKTLVFIISELDSKDVHSFMSYLNKYVSQEFLNEYNKSEWKYIQKIKSSGPPNDFDPHDPWNDDPWG